jgi:hypothetical protein
MPKVFKTKRATRWPPLMKKTEKKESYSVMFAKSEDATFTIGSGSIPVKVNV